MVSAGQCLPKQVRQDPEVFGPRRENAGKGACDDASRAKRTTVDQAKREACVKRREENHTCELCDHTLS